MAWGMTVVDRQGAFDQRQAGERAALGVDEELAHTSLRIGLGRFTTEHEVDTAVEELVRHVNKLREMSPLWEMAQEGIDIKSIEWAAH